MNGIKIMTSTWRGSMTNLELIYQARKGNEEAASRFLKNIIILFF